MPSIRFLCHIVYHKNVDIYYYYNYYYKLTILYIYIDSIPFGRRSDAYIYYFSGRTNHNLTNAL